MSAIFISHSSKDNEAAAQLRTLLESQGYASLFLDFDPEVGIPAGREWEEELYGQLRSSQAVLDRATAKGIYEVRAVLEALAAELFVERATEEDRQQLQVAFAAGKRAVERGDIAGSLDEWVRFYDALFAGARNESIAVTLRPLMGRIYMLRARSLSMPDRRAA
jgi:DNA-binding FadR family transcriptional regulator